MELNRDFNRRNVNRRLAARSTSSDCPPTQSGEGFNVLNGQNEVHYGSLLSLCILYSMWARQAIAQKKSHPNLGASVHCIPGFHRANAKALVVP